MIQDILTGSNLVISASTVTLGYIVHWYYKNFHYPRHVGPLKDIPGPSNEFLQTLRYMHYRITGEPGTMYKELHEMYGPIVHSGMGVLSVIDPEGIKQIYTSYKFNKEYRYDFYCEHIPNMFSTRDRKYHSIRKRMIAPAFNWNTLSKLEPAISYHCVDSLVTTINQAIDQGAKVVDMYDFLHKAIADVISDIVLGKCFNSLKQPDFPAHELSKHIAGTWGLKFAMPFLGFLKASHHPIITQAVVEGIKERREGKRREDILQTLIDSKDSETNKTFNDEEIIEEASLLLFAGLETTAVALAWTLYLLLQNPKAHDKLVEELVSNFPDKNTPISYNQCKDLPYLNGVLYESLRVKSPAGAVLTRVAPEGGVTICGHYVPEGTSIGTGGYAYHHSEKYFHNAEAFIPERWLGPDSNEMKNNSFAFSHGPRGCVGKNLAWMEMYITIANLIRNFEFNMPEGTILTGVDLFVLKAKEEKLIVEVSKRNN